MLWYVTGNLGKEVSIAMVENARKVFSLIPANKEDLVDIRCVALKNGSHVNYQADLLDPKNENSCLLSYFEFGPELMDLRSKMIHEVVMQYLDEPCFN